MRENVPAWLTHYLETGEEPEPGTPDADQFDNWYLLSGYHSSEGRDWPPPPPPAIPDWWSEEEKAEERARRAAEE